MSAAVSRSALRVARIVRTAAAPLASPLSISSSRAAHLGNVASTISSQRSSDATRTFQTLDRSKTIFSAYTIFKGKAALQISFAPPEVKLSPNGHYYKVANVGAAILKFAPAVPNQTRKYDWDKSALIHLSPTEMGSVLAYDGTGVVSCYHDPNLGSAEQGSVRKEFKIQRAEKGGFFFSLTVTSAQERANFVQPVSDAEMAVIKTLFERNIPDLLCLSSITPKVASDISEPN